MKYKAIVFDMDGTILDTLDDLMDGVNYMLAQKGFPQRTRKEIRDFVGNGVVRLVNLSVPADTSAEEREECIGIFKTYYNAHLRVKTAPYAGILPLLQKLREMGLKTAVVSNKFQEGVTGLAEDFFPGLFDYAIGEAAGLARKPAPDMVWKALDLLGVSKEEALYVGDSDVDGDTAANSQLDFAAVTWGFRDREVLETKDPVVILDRPEEFLSFLLK
ncbi:MAG: HAD-IA family hydrolase [Firmicutes bacterium]|nr:HAD-IA family hydrolase [Bacillota bacterium]